MARKVRVPVYVKMGAQLEGPITMSVEEGPALYEPRSRDMYAIRDPPIVIQRGGRRRVGYVVSRESAQTLAFDDVSGTFAPAPDPGFEWPPWIRSAQAVRAQNAQADGADYPLWMKVLLGFAGFAVGVVLVFVINGFAGGAIF